MINPLCASKKRKARAESRKRIILRYGALVVVNRSSLVDLLRRGTNETVSILSVGTEGEWTDRNDAYNDLQKYRS